MKQVRIYNRVFRIEKTVYSIQGISLPVSVSYRQMAIFTIAVLFMIVFNMFPPFSWLDYSLVEYVGIPVLVAWFFTNKTLDGKTPHRFIGRYVEHSFSPKHFARYQEIKKPQKKYYQYGDGVVFRMTPGGDI